MKASKRQKQILDLVARDGAQTVDHLSQYLGVSVATIRRDLAALESEGRVIRTHGGVRAGIPHSELTIAEKAMQNQSQKMGIARLAARKVHDFDTIIVDAGTTTGLFAKMLAGQDLTVITNSITALSILLNRRDITVMILGGTLRYVNQAIIGSSAINQLRNVFADGAFIGAYEFVIGHGITSPTPSQAALKSAMMESAKEIYILVDSSKFGQPTYKYISPVPQRATIITDDGIHPSIVQALQQNHLQVVMAQPHTAIDEKSMESPVN